MTGIRRSEEQLMTVKGTVCGTSGSVGILRNQRCHFFGPKIIVPACKVRRKLKRHTGATRSRTIGTAGAGAILNPTCAGARCPTHSADRDPAQIGARAERPEYHHSANGAAVTRRCFETCSCVSWSVRCLSVSLEERTS